MSETLYTRDEIIIQASTDAIWDVLVNPEMTKLYMYGCEVLSDWKIGSPVLWRGAEDGITYVKGELVAFEKNQEFAFTVIDPNGSYEDIPENYLTARYTLEKTKDGIKLVVTQGDYAHVEEGEKRYKDTIDAGGWQPVLEGIKKLAEQA